MSYAYAEFTTNVVFVSIVVLKEYMKNSGYVYAYHEIINAM